MFFNLINNCLRESRSKNSAERAVVFSSFFDRTNFYIPKNDVNKRLVYLKIVFRQLIKLITNGRQRNQHLRQPIHLHNSENGKLIWLNYINSELGLNIATSYSLRNLPFNLNALDRIILAFQLVISILVYNIILRRVRNAKQNLLGLPELIINLYILKKSIPHNSKVYYTGVYEPESNIISYYLNLYNKVNVSFFVSGTPLYRYQSKMFCESLYLSNAYQLEETTLFEKSMLIKYKHLLPPFSKKEIVLNAGNSAQKNIIALYTSGIWKRREDGLFFSEEVEKNEIKVLSFLNEYITKVNPDLKLILFLHPIEKKSKEDYETSIDYYSNFFKKTDNLQFAKIEDETVKHFNSAEVAITTISNTLFERLFAGFKTIVVNEEQDVFPFVGSTLEKIVANSYDKFKHLLDVFLEMDEKTWFKTLNLETYLSEELLILYTEKKNV